MKILIDGYNLLHASGVFGGVRGPRGFEASRQALLNQIAQLLGDASSTATVIFDATDAPPGLPDRSTHDGLAVRFARGYDSADTLIEELIESHQAPTSLTVVSSDNRVIAAARRRRAKPVGSEEWFAGLRTAARSKGQARDTKPPEPGPDGAEEWKRYFGL